MCQNCTVFSGRHPAPLKVALWHTTESFSCDCRTANECTQLSCCHICAAPPLQAHCAVCRVQTLAPRPLPRPHPITAPVAMVATQPPVIACWVLNPPHLWSLAGKIPRRGPGLVDWRRRRVTWPKVINKPSARHEKFDGKECGGEFAVRFVSLTLACLLAIIVYNSFDVKEVIVFVHVSWKVRRGLVSVKR